MENTNSTHPVVGTSFYLGIPDSTRHSAYDCVEIAADLGIQHFFTTVQMPEADITGTLDEFRRIGTMCTRRELRVMADAHPIAFRRVGGSVRDLEPFREIGITDLRLDAGFGDEAVQELMGSAKKVGMSLVINASPQTPASLQELKRRGLTLEGAVACHNYYPRMESGMSARYLAAQTDLLHGEGMLVMGFVASQKHHRYITNEGLSTIERHRYVEPHRACRELLTRKWCDHVYIGDQTDDEQELKQLVEARDNPHLVLRVAVREDANPNAAAIAFGRLHQHLPQEFEVTYRARGDRQRVGVAVIEPPRTAVERPRGTVAVDTVLIPRYGGEIHISKVDLPADFRTTVVGHVIEDDMVFLDAIEPRTEFQLEPVREGRRDLKTGSTTADDGVW